MELIVIQTIKNPAKNPINPDYAIGKFDLNKHTIKSKFKHYFKGSPNG